MSERFSRDERRQATVIGANEKYITGAGRRRRPTAPPGPRRTVMPILLSRHVPELRQDLCESIPHTLNSLGRSAAGRDRPSRAHCSAPVSILSSHADPTVASEVWYVHA